LNPPIVLQKRALRLINNSTFLEHTFTFSIMQAVKTCIYTFTMALYLYKYIQYFYFNRLHLCNTRNRNDLLPSFKPTRWPSGNATRRGAGRSRVEVMLAKNHSSWCEGKLLTLPFTFIQTFKIGNLLCKMIVEFGMNYRIL